MISEKISFKDVVVELVEQKHLMAISSDQSVEVRYYLSGDMINFIHGKQSVFSNNEVIEILKQKINTFYSGLKSIKIGLFIVVSFFTLYYFPYELVDKNFLLLIKNFEIKSIGNAINDVSKIYLNTLVLSFLFRPVRQVVYRYLIRLVFTLVLSVK